MRVTRGIPAAAAGPTALTIGNFDGVHLGHQAMLAELKRAAGASRRARLRAHVRAASRASSSPPTRRRRGSLRCARSWSCWRTAASTGSTSAASTTALPRSLRRISSSASSHAGSGARWLLVGDDFRFGARRAGDLVMLKQAAPAPRASKLLRWRASCWTASACRAPRCARRSPPASSTRAERLLGRAYSISGRVVRGDGLGRKLGFPTANVQMKHNRPPLTGIFAVRLHGAAAEPRAGRGEPGRAADGEAAGGAGAGSARARFRRRSLPPPRAGGVPAASSATRRSTPISPR